MDDELKRKIAASLDLPDDAAADPAVVAALESDPDARAFARGLHAVERALRSWPTTTRSAADWERFASEIERRLGQEPWESASDGRGALSPLAWDPLSSPPLREDDVEQAVSEPEHKAMATSHDDNQNDDDLEGLAALTRTSTAPTSTSLAPPPSLRPGPALSDDNMDESSGVVDIKTLAAIARSQSAPPPAASLAPTKEETSARADTAMLTSDPVPPRTAAAAAVKEPVAEEPAAKPEAKATKAAAKAEVAKSTPAPTPAKKKSSAAIWFIPLAAAAGIGGLAIMKRDALFPANADMAQASQPQRASGPEGAPSSSAEPSAAVEGAREPAEEGQAGAQAEAQAAVGAGTQPAAPTTVAQAEQAPEEPAAPPAAAPQTVAAAPAPAPPARSASAGGSAQATGTLAMAPASERAAAQGRESPGDAPAGGADGRSRRAPSSSSATTTADRGGGASPGAVASAETTVAARAEPAAAARPAAAAPPPAQPTTGAVAGNAQASSGAQAAAGSSPRSIDDLMAAATGSNRASSAGAAPAADTEAELPQRPSQRQVTSTLAPLSSAVRACTQGQTGMATVQLTIASDGNVQSARVSGPFSAQINSCIEGVVRRAQFPRFRQASVSIAYPFSIQPPRPTPSE